ncbi:MAG: DUF3105 domain-containing protein [Actinomycetota bacterium]
MSDRPTKKERREAARRARKEAQIRARRAQTRKRIVSVLVGAGVIGLIVALFMISSAGKRATVQELNDLATSVGCTELESYPSMGAEHIGQGETGTYERTPPDSGNHLGSGTSNTGVLDAPPPNELMTHNLEHGHVGLLYREGIDEALITALQDVARSDPSWVFAAQYAMPEGRDISMVAWRYRVDCPSAADVDADTLKQTAESFVAARKGAGPESVPGSAS